MRSVTPWTILLLGLSACTSMIEVPPEPDAPAPQSATAMRLVIDGRDVPRWGDAPFPGDVFADENGHPRLPAEFPNPRAGDALFTRIGELLGQRNGFCTTCNITFGFDGELDATSVADHVVIVNLGDGSETPVDYEWRADDEILSVRPQRGFALGPHQRYAVVLRRGLRGVDGLELAPPAALHDGGVFEHGLDELAGIGIQLEDIAGFTAFSTADPAGELSAIREAIHADSVPGVALDRVYAGAELDELLGPPGQSEAGIDIAATTGEGRAIRHATTAFVVAGRLVEDRFVEGTGSELGVTRRDVDGLPIPASRDDVPFVLIVPRGADLHNLPVIVAHHGFSASRTTGFALADTAGRAGWAVLSIDAYQHGDRAAAKSDKINAMREVDGADGFAETTKLAIVSRVFGLSGVPPEQVLSPEYALSAFEQFTADFLSTVRWVREGDASALAANTPGLDGLRFDPQRVVMLGNSMGAVVGMGVTAVEPDLAGAILNVMPGSIVETLAESGEFRPMMERLILPALGVDEPFDEVERSMLFDPTVDLYRWALEPVDPLALASRRATPQTLVQLAEHDEVAAPRPSESVVAVAGFADVTRYADAMHGMMEVTLQESRFQEPLIPPLVRRPADELLHNPTTPVHDEITEALSRMAP